LPSRQFKSVPSFFSSFLICSFLYFFFKTLFFVLNRKIRKYFVENSEYKLLSPAEFLNKAVYFVSSNIIYNICCFRQLMESLR
jgi:hypothetical protein